MRLQLQGTITKWNDDKGFGFITPLSGEKPVFVHIKAVKRRHQRPKLGQVVYYSISKDKQGRVRATDVSYVEKEHSSPLRIMLQVAAFIFVALFFAALAVLTFVMQIIPVFIIALYAIASGITFIAYAGDKSAAKNGRWRTSCHRSLKVYHLRSPQNVPPAKFHKSLFSSWLSTGIPGWFDVLLRSR